MGLENIFKNILKKDESNLKYTNSNIEENHELYNKNKSEEEVKNIDNICNSQELEDKEDSFINQESEDNNEIEEFKDISHIESDFIEDNESSENKEKKGLFSKLKDSLKKTSDSFTEKFDNLFKSCVEIDEELYEEIEEILITSDISFKTSIKIVEKLRDSIKKKNISDINLVKPELKEVLLEMLENNDSKLDLDNNKNVIIIIGVNGVGKTTTIGKLAFKLKSQNKKVLLAAGDTFRAAAEEQLEIWANRIDVDIVRYNQSGADPSAVIYDSITKAKNKNIDFLICDTAGRLHNKTNLMNELGKIVRTVEKEYPEAKKDIFLVVDATTGQNALNQVKTFNEVTNLTGVILTKLDGTAKGGIILSIIDEYKIPIKFVGVGEKVEDLQEFSSKNFVNALF